MTRLPPRTDGGHLPGCHEPGTNGSHPVGMRSGGLREVAEPVAEERAQQMAL